MRFKIVTPFTCWQSFQEFQQKVIPRAAIVAAAIAKQSLSVYIVLYHCYNRHGECVQGCHNAPAISRSKRTHVPFKLGGGRYA